MSKIVIATHNAGKRLEIAALLEPLGISVIGAGELDLPEPEETGATFIENARIKAQSASELTGLAALSDDSGLVVPGLDGQPGIYSARWAGPNRDFNLAMTKVNDGLTERNADRAAYMVCVLCLSLPGGGAARPFTIMILKGALMALWYGPRVVTKALAMIPYSSRKAIHLPLVKWTRMKKKKSAIGVGPLNNYWPLKFCLIGAELDNIGSAQVGQRQNAPFRRSGVLMKVTNRNTGRKLSSVA